MSRSPTDREQSPADRHAGGGQAPLADHAAVAVVGSSRREVAREALKIARAESQVRPVLIVDLLGQGSALDRMVGDDDPHGVSDAARFGVSLAKVARPVPNADSLFVVPGGTESPLADDVLNDHLWASWSEQCRRAGALMVVAAPADLPAVGKAIDQLEGVVMVGDARPPDTVSPLLGRVPAPRQRLPAGMAAPRRISPEEIAVVREAGSRHGLRIAISTVAVLGAIGAGAWWAEATGRLPWVAGSPAAPAPATTPIVMPGDPVTTPSADAVVPAATGTAAEWSVEFASVNSLAGALARVRQTLDSVPVPTFSPAQPGATPALWYRLTAGAFTRMESADSLLSALRDRGMIEAGGGQVIHTPLAWLLEDGVAADDVPSRLFAWRQQGLPAYALYDQGVARVYAGAFGTEPEARLLSPILDSLNLHAILTTRVGSIR